MKKKQLIALMLLAMKYTLIPIIIVLSTFFTVVAKNAKGQDILDEKVTLNSKNGPLKEILADLERQEKIYFVYSLNILRDKENISYKCRNKKLSEVFSDLLSPLSISYKIVSKNRILLLPAKEYSADIEYENAPYSIIVHGRVTSTNGEPLAGASINVKNTKRYTTTNALGEFDIEAEDQNSILIISFTGFDNKEIIVGKSNSFSVSLSPKNKVLDDVVVVGYGERKKENYTGAVSTINSKEIVQAPVANISNALTGRLSGLISYQRNGEPGRDGSNLLIRGVSTTGDNSPLVVIDGIPRGDFSQIDPNEIQSITLLKDPASAAVFGVRAANGVILITTKRGKAGKSSLSFSVRSDWQKPTRLPKYMDSYNYASLLNQGSINAGNTAPFSQEDLDAYKNGTDPDGHPNTDWIKATLNDNAPQQQYNLSLSGGTEKTKYFISAGHIDQGGLYANSNFKRYNFRSNIDVDATSTTRISLDVSGRNELRNAPSQFANQLIYFALYAPPIFPAYFSNGLPGSFPSGRNPAERAKNGGYSKENSSTLLSSLSINQQLPFIKGLSIKGILAYDRNYGTNKVWKTPYKVYTYNRTTKEYTQINGDGINTISLLEGYNQSSSLTLEAHLNYQQTFGKHAIGGLFLYSQNEGNYNYLSGSRDNFISPAIDQIFAGDDATQIINGGASVSGRRGYVGRLSYVFDNKYLFEGNFRYDGSFNFAPGKKWGFFPSISAGWKISQENFFQKITKDFDYLKLRGSYGILGNDRIEPYRYLSSYQYGMGYPFGEGGSLAMSKGLSSTGVPDPNTTWETAKSLNIGFDGSAWRRKLTFEFDWFHKRTSDILGQRLLSIPATFGDILPLENLNIVDNKGVEISIGHENTIAKKINYFLKGNVTYAHNKIVFQDEPASVNPNQKRTGRSIDQFFGYKAIGLFNSQAEIDAAPVQQNAVKPGDIRYADINGRNSDGKLTGMPDGKVDADDITAIGYSPIPQIIYGLSGGLSYKGVDISFLFQGATKVNAFITGELAWPFYNGAKALVQQSDYWTPEHTNAKYPRITDVPTANNTVTSSYWLKDASYLRLKNLELGYSLSQRLLTRIKMSNARLFVSGQNLITFDKLKVTDPEGPGESGTGFNGNSSRGWFYPQQKVIAVGINVTF